MTEEKKKIKCALCDIEYLRINKSHHIKSKKHIANENEAKLKLLLEQQSKGKDEIKKNIMKETEEEMLKAIKSIIEKKVDNIIDIVSSNKK